MCIPGAILGLNMAVNSLVRTFSPTIGGYLLERYGFSAFGYLGTAFSVVLTCVLFIKHQRKALWSNAKWVYGSLYEWECVCLFWHDIKKKNMLQKCWRKLFTQETKCCNLLTFVADVVCDGADLWWLICPESVCMGSSDFCVVGWHFENKRKNTHAFKGTLASQNPCWKDSDWRSLGCQIIDLLQNFDL